MRLTNRLRFALERFLIRGVHFQLLAVAALIGIISVIGGTLIGLAGAEASAGDSIWWAFLRLTDPGYLGDDTGAFRRVVSTILTVLGYVLFMGSLVAIMTQWLNSTMRRLEAGYTPVRRRDHLLVVGWMSRTATVVEDLLRSEERVERFLRRRGVRRLQLVLLAESVTPALAQELIDRTGERYDRRRITLRSGSALRADHLARVDFLRAAAILLPAGEFGEGGADTADTHTIKALLSMSHHPAVEDPALLPLVVVEVLDQRKADLAESAYAGPIEVLASDAVVSRLMAQNVRHAGLSRVYTELLTHAEGNEIFARELPVLAGERLEDLGPLFPHAILLGVVRGQGRSFVPLLNPPPGTVAEPGDRFVFLAREYEHTAPVQGDPPRDVRRGLPRSPALDPDQTSRVLVLGWSHKVAALVAEFASYPGEHFDLVIASSVPATERSAELARYGIDAGRVRTEQVEADYTVPSELARIDPAGFDNVIMMGSDWLESGEESDARTVVGYLLLQKLLAEVDVARRPRVLVELVDPENVGLLGQRPGEVIISPVILSHMLSQVALRRELNAVFDELFTAGGAEITFRPITDYVTTGSRRRFAALQEAARERGDTALGVRTAIDGPVFLNPGADEAFDLDDEDVLVVLTTYD